MRGVTSEGITIATSTSEASLPPPRPESPTVRSPRVRASRTPATTFSESPEVEKATTASPGRPCASTSRA